MWINLPVKDLSRSKKFFKEIGFTLNQVPGNADDKASLVIGDKNVVVMLFLESDFEKFLGNHISNPVNGNEVLFTIGTDRK